jgi:hypothetical protein
MYVLLQNPLDGPVYALTLMITSGTRGIAAMAGMRQICESLHLPVQSGSNSMLGQMMRPLFGPSFPGKRN